MVARTLGDLVVYQKSQALADAVSAMLQRPGLRQDWDLKRQMAAASAAIPANIAEGFGQQSDRQFAKYLFIARGSAHEVSALLKVAVGRGHVSPQEWSDMSDSCESVGRMLSALIKYLRASDRRERG